MPSVELAKFLSVALDVQAAPYPGIHVGGGVAAASDGRMLVAAKWGTAFLRGEGTISPKAAGALAALAGVTHIGDIEVSGNRVSALVRGTRYDGMTGEEVAGEFRKVELPEFWCRHIPVERMLNILTDERLFWANIAENPTLKTLKEAGAKDYVALTDAPPRTGGELFRPKTDDDTLWYSVAQLRRGLRLFGARAHLSVRRNAKGWLAFEDRFGQTFAITPFVKCD